MLHPLPRDGYVRFVPPFQYDRDEPRIRGTGIIDILVDEGAFPGNAMPFAWLLCSHHPTGVRWGTDHEHIICITNLAIHPAWEALGWGIFILVKDTVNAVGAQSIGER
jgi:hypothetical protein